MYCKKCGKQNSEGAKFCTKCGAHMEDVDNNSNSTVQPQSISSTLTSYNKCLPAFILGLIGGILGIFGGFCTTICASFAYSNDGAIFVLLFIGSIIGLVGACLCMNKALLGSILELVAALMIIIGAYVVFGADLMTVLAMLLFLAGGIIGIVYSVINNKKK